MKVEVPTLATISPKIEKTNELPRGQVIDFKQYLWRAREDSNSRPPEPKLRIGMFQLRSFVLFKWTQIPGAMLKFENSLSMGVQLDSPIAGGKMLPKRYPGF